MTDNIKTLVDLFDWRVNQKKDSKLFTFLRDSGGTDEITYSEMMIKAKIVASRLQSRKLRGQRALLLYPPGLDYIIGYFGCLYAGVIAVPVYPPDPNRLTKTLPRILSILKDSSASIALTTNEVLEEIQKWKNNDELAAIFNFKGNSLNLNSIPWMATDEYDNVKSDAYEQEIINEDTVAYLQYTSGSTGTPRGVIITHKNLIHNSHMIQQGYELFSEHEGVIWLPIYHDMGLIGGILQPIFSGFHATLMSPTYFLKRPLRWLQLISDIQDTPVVSGGPNFAYDLCVRAASPSKIASLDLSNWKIAFSGAEPVRYDTIEKFSEVFKPAGFKKSAFYPCYGLAEATLIVSGGEKKAEPTSFALDKFLLRENKAVIKNEFEENKVQHFVSSGSELFDSKIIIVNPETLIKCKENEIGEIWTASSSVAQGYWNKAKETEEVFNAFTSDTNDGPFLRTGDLGFLSKNELFVTGRLKDLIIIHGTNHYPQDIEFTVENSNKLLRPSSVAAFSIDVNDEEKLVVVQEARAKNNIDWNEVINDIRKAISESHNIQVYSIVLIKAKTIFKTSSGKIRRRATKQAYLKGELDVIAEWKLDENKKTVKQVNNAIVENEIKKLTTGKFMEIQKWLVDKISDHLKIEKKLINFDEPFTQYGIDSALAVNIVGELEDRLNASLNATLLWEYPTLNKLFTFLENNFGENYSEDIQITKKDNIVANEPVAIVGIGLRFPKADSVDEFWNLLINKVDGVSDIPKSRWNVDEFYDPNLATPGKMVTKKGGFLKDIDKFDPHFFGISPREARKIDPQQRLVLEMAWEAIENSAIGFKEFEGSNTGVFIGISNNDYSVFQRGNLNELDAYSGTGSSFSIVANRVSYTFDFHGPSIALDTACSSSLVAIHLAVNSLRKHECDAALAGGVNLILTPDINISFSQARMMSPTGSCKTFDALADGYIRGEGGGIVVLKRLSDAIKNDDNIIAVIKGSAINQDGKSNGITAPNRLAQEKVIKLALLDAGVSAEDIDFVEAHGTGTILGDPIEFQALANINKERNPDNPLRIGSVKSNIGHLESASGIAGFIKVTLALQHKTIPPNINFSKINPHIEIEKYPIKISLENSAWTKNKGKRYAGVSAFGFGGTNAHVILEEAPSKIEQDNTQNRSKHIFTISAQSNEGLKDLAARYENYLSMDEMLSVGDISYSVNTGRSQFSNKLAVIVSNSSELKEKLNGYLKGENTRHLYLSNDAINGKIAFMFTGQGAQYFEMGKELYNTSPTFNNIINKCDQILKEEFEIPLIDLLYSPEINPEDINQTAYTQPAIFSVEYALAMLWQSWGVNPDILVGHSIGEITAAVFANSLSLEDGLRLVAIRGKLMQSLPQDGDMSVIFAQPEGIQPLLQKFTGLISIAGINGPNNTVISGEKKAVARFIELVNQNGIKSKILNVSHAFHSQLMDPILDEFKNEVSKFQFKSPTIPVVSNVTGEIMDSNTIPDAEYWKTHIRSTVNFYGGLKTLINEQVKVFIEIGPNPSLISMSRVAHPEYSALWLPSLRRNHGDWESLLSSLANFYVNGNEIDWKGFDKDYHRKKLQLPTYPFQRKRYWIDGQSPYSSMNSKGFIKFDKGLLLHPLAQNKIQSPAIKDTIFESRINKNTTDWLKDHKINGNIVFPATAYIESIIFALNKEFNTTNLILRDLVFLNILKLNSNNKEIQIVLKSSNNKTKSIQIFSSISNGSSDLKWQLNSSCSAKVIFSENGEDIKEFKSEIDVDNIRKSYKQSVDLDEYYNNLYNSGLQYSNSFQSIKELYTEKSEALGYIKLDSQDIADYIVHPAILDSALQIIGAVVNKNEDEIYLPVNIGEFRLFNKIENEIWSKGILVEQTSDTIKSNFAFYDSEGKILGYIKGFLLKKVDKSLIPDETSVNPVNWFHRIKWKETPLINTTQSKNTSKSNLWIVVAENSNNGNEFVKILEKNSIEYLLINSNEKTEKLNENRCNLDLSKFDQVSQFLDDLKAKLDFEGIIFLPDNAGSDELLKNSKKTFNHLIRTSFNLLNIYQSILSKNILVDKKIVFLTQNAHKINNADNINPANRAIWGFGNVALLEHPEIDLLMVDYQSESDLDSVIQELSSESLDKRIAFRNGKRFAAFLSKYLKPNSSASIITDTLNSKLTISKKGILDNLEIKEFDRSNLNDDEVEIRVISAGLNFRDVMNALDLYPGDAGQLGGECSGIITRIGNKVNELKIGDKVFGIAPGSFANFTTTKAQLLIPKPENISFPEAATIPITFLTSYYSLVKLAKIKKGDKVLIHAATGGVGQAAIQICRMFGAEIFATAGNEEKRAFLKANGIKYIMNSRSTEFADEIRNFTNGRGVDIVLNSLSGEFIEKGLSTLANKGRFLEIGKVGIWSEEKVKEYRADINYFIIALDDLSQNNPKMINELFKEIIPFFKDGHLSPLPKKVFSFHESQNAFRFMAQTKHIGKVIINVENEKSEINNTISISVEPKGQYLITGGFGALGMFTAEWLVSKGVKKLILIGRNKPSTEVDEKIKQFEKQGISIYSIFMDITSEKDSQGLIDKIIKQTGAHIDGIFHTAGVLDDAIILQQNHEKFSKVLRPKVLGSLNLINDLHHHQKIDFIVYYSSIVSLLGAGGQSNYAMANSFLDGYAEHLNSQGINAVSINWGPWKDKGMNKREKAFQAENMGLKAIDDSLGVKLLDELTTGIPSNIGMFYFDINRLKSHINSKIQKRFLSDLIDDKLETDNSTEENEILELIENLKSTEIENRIELLRNFLKEQIINILGLDLSFNLDTSKNLSEMGLDSLMAIELKNKIDRAIGHTLPATLVFNYPTINDISKYILNDILKLGETIEEENSLKTDKTDMDNVIDEIENLSDEEAEALLLKKLDDSIDNL